MKAKPTACIVSVAVLTVGVQGIWAAARDYPVRPVAFTEVKLTDAFWAPRIETNRKVTIPYAFGQCEQTGRIDNFALAGGLIEGEDKGDFPFDDTDPYKILEGASYVLSVRPDPELDQYLDALIAKIAAAQEDDGYLYTCRTNQCERLKGWFGDARWEKVAAHSHELYNMGHLYEAAAAHYQATGKRNLLDIALKNADLLATVFGPGNNEDAPGHQVIEMGLVKLYRVTGDEQYLNLAKFFLDTRGPGGEPYSQAHQKPYEQSEAVGHAVRATYMYSGMADVAAMTADARYLDTIGRIWDDVVAKKLYLTGGIGARGQGEAFGDAYELPNETAYCETCAAIGNVYWNHRMFLSSGDAKYLDVLERSLYNGVISGVSLEGNRFFYPNPLASRGQHERSPWFGCACCPGNIARFIASVPGYVYAQTDNKLYVNLYAQGTATVKAGGQAVRLTQETEYPWDGQVKLTVEPERAGRFAIYLRIPGWARGEPVPSDLYRHVEAPETRVGLKINDQRARLVMEKGFARLDREWNEGDVVELYLPMPIRQVLAHEQVEDNAGRVALERGPLVYCVEGPDNAGHVFDLMVNGNSSLAPVRRADLLGGVTTLEGKAVALRYAEDGKAIFGSERDVVAIPYYAWAHRGPGPMAVWLAHDASVAEPALAPGMLANPSFETAAGDVPSDWTRQTYGGQAAFEYAQSGHTGERSVRISSTEGGDAGWLTSVPVRPFSRYRLTGWIKTENVQAGSGQGALLNLHNIQPTQTQAITGTQDWTQLDVEFDTGGNDAVQINCLLGGWGQSTGAAWFDDVALEHLSTREIDPKVRIDARDTGEPISKYIYGQFIEHLGRCIYGGIWAEMLEDRKFFHPVGSELSAWETIGSTSGVTMERKDPFVGAHTPVVHAASGLRQRGLGLVVQKRYGGYVWIKPATADGVNVEVTLVWGSAPTQRQVNYFTVNGDGYIQCPLSFTAGDSTDQAMLELRVSRGSAAIGTLSLMPADNVNGMRADTLKLLKQLNAPVYRWPGGNFVSGYNWRDGIGPRDKRPPRKNPAWQGIEHNDFGLDEFIAFCKEVGAEPMIAVNAGFGDDYSAAQEVEYANGSPDTLMGQWRGVNGHVEPYGVTWWCVGNEMYGTWQLGHMALDQYVLKHNLFAQAMRAVDPNIELIGVGAVGEWSEGMLTGCAENMDLISEHFYCQERDSVIAHMNLAPDAVRRIVDAHRDYRERLDALEGRDIRIAIDEWNYWYGPHVFGELGTRYFMKDALGIAAGLHEMARHSDLVFMANYAQTVNVIGAIKTTKTAAALETTGLVLKLYRNHFGTIPAAIASDTHPLDVAAAWTADRSALTIGVVNPTEQAWKLPLDIEGADLTGAGRAWIVANDDPMAYNQPGKVPSVTIEEKPLTGVSDALTVPAYSVNLYELDVR
ncbi:MAG: glycoside hydrolase family 127 protein [Sedimentisphaerales bacterium]|nr:glycoside hydrolase family 127 protein [Sedimentisphaerales bacterium]